MMPQSRIPLDCLIYDLCSFHQYLFSLVRIHFYSFAFISTLILFRFTSARLFSLVCIFWYVFVLTRLHSFLLIVFMFAENLLWEYGNTTVDRTRAVPVFGITFTILDFAPSFVFRLSNSPSTHCCFRIRAFNLL